ncbi:MAG TPA: hypothetical protein VM163_10125 [bacterium]|nr:hypothetical protein [bacterium]
MIQNGKRLSLTDASGTRKFFYDRNDVIQKYNSDWSTVNKEYTHGPWVDEPLSMTDKTAKQAGGDTKAFNYDPFDRMSSVFWSSLSGRLSWGLLRRFVAGLAG